jgi:rod shape-determining protein MreD
MARHMRIWPVVVAFIAAISLEILPIPDVLQAARPPFAAMVLIYWVMMCPERFGIGTAFIMGICLDILHGQLLGQNALTLTVVAYLTMRFHRRIRIFPLWQLTSAVFALLLAGAVIDFLIEGIAGLPPTGIGRWTRVLSGALTWPLILALMVQLRIQVEFRESTLN